MSNPNLEEMNFLMELEDDLDDDFELNSKQKDELENALPKLLLQ